MSAPDGGAGAGAGAGSAFDAHAPAEGFRLRGAAKLAFVTEMFDRVAPKYDTVNLFISLGQTTLWRVLALAFLPHLFRRDAAVLDVGCGTGYVTWFLEKRYGCTSVEGLDCSPVMLAEASARLPGRRFVRGDACALPYHDDSFDVVTTVFTLRNFPELQASLREMVRVLRPGGTLVLVDAFPPADGLMRRLLALWLNCVVPLLAALVTRRDPKPYRYLAASIQQTVSVEAVAAALRDAGCDAVAVRTFTFGAAARVLATKPGGGKRE